MRYNFLFFLFLFFACQNKQPEYTQLEGQAQGTTFHITYFDPAGRDFSGPVDSLFRLIDRSMSLWDSTSIISRVNRNEAGVLLDEHFIAVFQRSQAIAAATGGMFDITVGPLVRAWGFSYKKGLPPPDSALVDSLRQLIGFQKVRLENGVLQKDDPRMEVDVNAIAQGYTVDVLAQYLEKQGVQNYMVEVGGEVRTAGKNARGELWRIGIDKPVADGGEGRPLQTVVSMENQALATSGSYRKFVERDGKKYSHAIDPQTGYPITHNLLSISVLADDCTTADAYATAFLVLGLEKSMKIAQEQGLKVYGIYTDENGALQVKSTFEMH
ncbi:MAG: FAD:protein FMN transferase [Lewinellaceae bacterium]|nr:FAD:protein FMN transferase [Lewinellaceae bacterium]MCB9331285.1 FAD:protein FMN transferase [Lewinellaceae bacterium]